jgi:addiction module HigA family antidote
MKAQTGPPIVTLELARNRRAPAVHPGPQLERDFLAPLGLDAASLAPLIGMEAERLRRMLAGIDSIDVPTAIRLARSLQINPQTLIERQARADFAKARVDAELESVPLLVNDGRVSFPASGFLRGRLAGLRENSPNGGVRDETLGFFADASADDSPPHKAYSLEFGGKLRVYDALGNVFWTGVVLRGLDGRMLLPYARPSEWIDWFTASRRADYLPPA